MRYSAFASVCGLAILLGVGACGDDDDDHDHDPHGNEIPECVQIFETCHPRDLGEDPKIHECHVLGEEGTKDECTAKSAECLTACTAPGNDAGSD